MRAVQGISIVLAASLALAAWAGVAASAAPDKNASALLAGAVKEAMQKKLKASVPGLKMTKVNCNVPKNAKSLAGKCVARFTVAKFSLNGVYGVKANMTGAGKLTYSTTSLKCTDSKSNQTIPC